MANNKIKKILCRLLLAGALGSGTLNAQSLDSATNLETVLNSIIKTQEIGFGIKYTGTPKVLSFNEQQNQGYASTKSSLGRYRPETSTIELSSSLFSTNEMFHRVLNHELGHAYVEQIAKKLKIFNIVERTFVGITLNEGIASYFDAKSAGIKIEPLPLGEYEESRLLSFDPRKRPYVIGLDIVAPILDKYGVEEGTNLILKNMPKNLSDLKDFRNKMLSSGEKCK